MRLLFDAGVSGRVARLRMAEYGKDPRDVDALFITHEHSDHIRCAGVFQRLFKVPIYLTKKTFQANRCDLGKLQDVRHFTAGKSVQIRDVMIHSIPTAHDAVDGVGYVVEHDGRRLGILTDLGHPFAALKKVLSELDAVYLESNYDPQMLANGPYPPDLKARIAGQHGHLSNEEAADALKHSINGRMKWLALAHLSQDNNTPDIAVETHRATIGKTLPIHLATRFNVSAIWEV